MCRGRVFVVSWTIIREISFRSVHGRSKSHVCDAVNNVHFILDESSVELTFYLCE